MAEKMEHLHRNKIGGLVFSMGIFIRWPLISLLKREAVVWPAETEAGLLQLQVQGRARGLLSLRESESLVAT